MHEAGADRAATSGGEGPEVKGPQGETHRRGRLLVDITPLRESREFRLLYFGQALSYVGSQLTFVATQVQVFNLTSSSLAVGALGLVQFVPLVVGSLLGGAWADAVDRRRLMLIAQVLLALTSVGMFVNAIAPSPFVWVAFVLSALGAGFSGLDHPTRSAAIPSLVRREQLAPALALNQIVWHGGGVIGPAIAGLLIAAFGVQAAYGVDVLTFSSAIVALLLMRPILPARPDGERGRPSLLEGVRFLKGRKALQGSFVIDVNAMVFGMPRALFPAIGLTVFGGGPEVVGLLYAAPAAGAMLGAILSGPLGRIDRQGRAVLWSVVVWGGAVAAFGIVRWLPLALLLLAVAGAADVVSAVFRNSILQLSVPDHLRGRLSAVHIVVVTGGPRLGDVEAGAVASLTSPVTSVVSGGLACMAGVGVVARLYPELARWRLSRVESPGERATAIG